MGVIHVIAYRPGAGKTCLAGALLWDLAQRSQLASYYKPFSASPLNDPDVSFVSQHLLPEGSPPGPNPQLIPSTPGAIQVSQLVQETIIARDAATDITLVEGPDLTLADGQSSSLGTQLASIASTRVILIVQYQRSLDADALINLADPWRQQLAGLVINHSPIHRQLEIVHQLINPLRDNGLPVLGAIPEDRFMLSVTVEQLFEHLNGTWVQEPTGTDAPIDRILIGGNIMDSGPSYFCRYANQAVITRAERPDIQMASLMCETRCLVLTGGGEPTEYVRVEANKKGVPLIAVSGDTISTAESLNGLLDRVSPHSISKVQRFSELLREHLDQDPLDAALGQYSAGSP